VRQGQKIKGQARLLLRLKVYHIYRKEGLGTSKLLRRSSMRHINSTASYEGLRSFVLARGRRHTLSAVPGGHAACFVY